MATAVVAGVEVSTDHLDRRRARVLASARFADRLADRRRAPRRRGGRRRGEVDAAVGGGARGVSRVGGARAERPRCRSCSASPQGILARAKELAAVETADNGSLLARQPASRGAARRAEHRVLRRLGATKLVGHTIDSPEVDQPRALRSGGRRGADHAVERAADADHVEGRPGARGRQHGRREAAGMGAAHVLAARRHRARGRRTRRRAERRAGHRRRGRRRAGRPSRTSIASASPARPRPRKSIGEAAARSITPLAAELGGKSPFIVCADADLDAAAQTVAGAVRSTPARSAWPARASLVERSHRRRVPRQGARRRAAHMVVGRSARGRDACRPADHARALRARARLRRARQAARRRPLWGGARDAAGELYFEPTLFDRVSGRLEIAQREVFGPVLTWQTFARDDEAVELANGTRYGLAGVLFTREREARAWRSPSASSPARSG